MARRQLPAEVIEGIEDYLAEGIPRMDGNGLMATGSAPGTGEYLVDLCDGQSFTFHEAQLAPPSGVFASNYSR